MEGRPPGVVERQHCGLGSLRVFPPGSSRICGPRRGTARARQARQLLIPAFMVFFLLWGTWHGSDSEGTVEIAVTSRHIRDLVLIFFCAFSVCCVSCVSGFL